MFSSVIDDDFLLIRVRGKLHSDTRIFSIHKKRALNVSKAIQQLELLSRDSDDEIIEAHFDPTHFQVFVNWLHGINIEAQTKMSGGGLTEDALVSCYRLSRTLECERFQNAILDGIRIIYESYAYFPEPEILAAVFHNKDIKVCYDIDELENIEEHQLQRYYASWIYFLAAYDQEQDERFANAVATIPQIVPWFLDAYRRCEGLDKTDPSHGNSEDFAGCYFHQHTYKVEVCSTEPI